MKIGNLIAGVVRHTVSGVASTAGSEFKKAGKSMVGQVAPGSGLSKMPTAQPHKKTYGEFTARGETKKFGLNLLSQVSGQHLTYSELQEVQAGNTGTGGNTPHDQLRAKINQMYKTHDQRNKQQEAANKKKQEEDVTQANQESKGELQSSGNRFKTMNPAIGKTRTEIGKNFGAE